MSFVIGHLALVLQVALVIKMVRDTKETITQVFKRPFQNIRNCMRKANTFYGRYMRGLPFLVVFCQCKVIYLVAEHLLLAPALR